MQQVVNVYLDQWVAGGKVVALQVVEWAGQPAYTVEIVNKNGEKRSLTLTPPGKILQDVIRPKDQPADAANSMTVLRA